MKLFKIFSLTFLLVTASTGFAMEDGTLSAVHQIGTTQVIKDINEVIDQSSQDRQDRIALEKYTAVCLNEEKEAPPYLHGAILLKSSPAFTSFLKAGFSLTQTIRDENPLDLALRSNLQDVITTILHNPAGYRCITQSQKLPDALKACTSATLVHFGKEVKKSQFIPAQCTQYVSQRVVEHCADTHITQFINAQLLWVPTDKDCSFESPDEALSPKNYNLKKYLSKIIAFYERAVPSDSQLRNDNCKSVHKLALIAAIRSLDDDLGLQAVTGMPRILDNQELQWNTYALALASQQFNKKENKLLNHLTKAEIATPDSDFLTRLMTHLIAPKGNKKSVAWCLEHGARVDGAISGIPKYVPWIVQDRPYRAPIYAAAILKGDREMITLLKEHGLNLNDTNWCYLLSKAQVNDSGIMAANAILQENPDLVVGQELADDLTALVNYNSSSGCGTHLYEPQAYIADRIWRQTSDGHFRMRKLYDAAHQFLEASHNNYSDNENN